MTSDLAPRLREALLVRRLHLRLRGGPARRARARGARAQRDHARPAADRRRLAARDAGAALPAADHGEHGRGRGRAAGPGGPLVRGGVPRAVRGQRRGPPRRAALRRRTSSDLWVVSDLTPGLDGLAQRVGCDHVLGISAASTSLAQLTLRAPVGSALDLGTGCGVQALHLAEHCRRVVATDVNRRALRLARFNADLNGVGDRVEVVEGTYFEPVAGGRFDLIATNPPFVISPATGERLVYRDSGLPGDRVVRTSSGGARAPRRGRLVPGPGQLGRRPGRALGGAARGLARRRVRRVRGPARGRRPGGLRRAVAQGRRHPPLHGGGDPPRREYRRPLRHLAVVVRPSRASRASGSGGSACAASRTPSGTGERDTMRLALRRRAARRPRPSPRGAPRPARDVGARRPPRRCAPTSPGDPRRARGGGPRDHRPAPAGGPAARPSRRHRGGRPGRGVRRRPQRRAGPRRPGSFLGRDPATLRGTYLPVVRELSPRGSST